MEFTFISEILLVSFAGLFFPKEKSKYVLLRHGRGNVAPGLMRLEIILVMNKGLKIFLRPWRSTKMNEWLVSWLLFG